MNKSEDLVFTISKHSEDLTFTIIHEHSEDLTFTIHEHSDVESLFYPHQLKILLPTSASTSYA